MIKNKFWIWFGSLVVSGLIGVVTVGALLPASVQVSRTQSIPFSAMQTWDVISNVVDRQLRYSDIQRITILSSGSLTGQLGIGLRWQEYLAGGGYRMYDTLESMPGQKWVIRRVGGSDQAQEKWQYVLSGTGNMTLLTITLDRQVMGIFPRVYAWAIGNAQSVHREFAVVQSAISKSH